MAHDFAAMRLIASSGVRAPLAGILARLALACIALAGLWSPARAQDSQAPQTPVSVPSDRKATNVAVITIHGEIDAQGVMAESVARRITMAERAGADALVFDINTPGGAVDSVLRICTSIKGSSIRNTAAWINPDAYSGGAIIALACRRILVNDPANFGDAMPIAGGPMGIVPKSVGPEMLKKVLPPLLAEVVDSTRRYNDFWRGYYRDEYLMQALVANDVELWLVRNPKTGVQACIDREEFAMLFPGESAGGPTRLVGVPGAGRPTAQVGGVGASPAGSRKIAAVSTDVESRQSLTTERPRFTPGDAGSWELVTKVSDGTAPAMFKVDDMVFFGLANNEVTTEEGRMRVRPIRSDADLKSYFQATNLFRYERSWSEGLVLFMTNFVVRGLLVVIFLVALFIEMTHPGVLLPAAVALLALIGLIAPPMLMGMAGWWPLAAVLVGIGLLLLEAFVIPGFGIPGVIGLVLLFSGLVGTFLPRGDGALPDPGEGGRSLLYGSTVVLLSMFTAGVAMYYIAKHFGSLPVLGKLVLQDPGTTEESEGFLDEAMSADSAPAVKVGDRAVSVTPMRPSGKIQIGEETYDAVAEFGFIDAGRPVRVVVRDGFRLGVEEVPGPSRGESA